jgi:hypothetical protein
MKIVLSDTLIKYLSRKNINNVTIDSVKLKICWGRPFLPSVLTGKPDRLQDFISCRLNEVTFYIHKNLYDNEKELHLDLRNFLFIKEIFIKNFNVI